MPGRPSPSSRRDKFTVRFDRYGPWITVVLASIVLLDIARKAIFGE